MKQFCHENDNEEIGEIFDSILSPKNNKKVEDQTSPETTCPEIKIPITKHASSTVT